MVRNIVMKQHYYERSEDLFLIFANNIKNSSSDISWLLEFLKIILNNYTALYYKTQKQEKSTNNHKTKYKCLNNIQKLILACKGMLTKGQQEQEIFKEVMEFWCREDLEPIQGDILAFAATSLSTSSELATFCLANSNCRETIVSLMNQSYCEGSEVDTALELTYTFLV